jgi:hypothetical protein
MLAAFCVYSGDMSYVGGKCPGGCPGGNVHLLCHMAVLWLITNICGVQRSWHWRNPALMKVKYILIWNLPIYVSFISSWVNMYFIPEWNSLHPVSIQGLPRSWRPQIVFKKFVLTLPMAKNGQPGNQVFSSSSLFNNQNQWTDLDSTLDRLLAACNTKEYVCH